MRSSQNKRMTSLPVNESFIEKSIIAQLPESPQEQDSLPHLQAQLARLQQQLQFYKKQAFPKGRVEPFSFRDIEKGPPDPSASLAPSHPLRQENEELKRLIKSISEELRKRGETSWERERESLAGENARLQGENEQLRKEAQESRRKAVEQEAKVEEMTEAALDHLLQIEALTRECERMKREGARRSTIGKYGASRTLSQLQSLEGERVALLVSEKNKEYEQLYLKYQSLENELHAAQEINSDLERERKFLSERLSDIEIHTEGDEIVGELENKLVLMSTELMRLGNLSRSKTQENKELSIRLKELILKRENLEKEVIERDKLILAYKEEIRVGEARRSGGEEREGQARERGKLAREVERLTALLKEKSEALKNSEIKNAILEEKNGRLQREGEELERENKELAAAAKEGKSIHTKVLNLEAEVNYFKEANLGLKDEMKRYESKFYENRSDIDNLAREKEALRQNHLDLQDKLRSAQEELRRAQLQLDDKTMELRELTHKSEEKVMLKTNEIRKLEEKVIILEKEVQRTHKSKADAPKYEELVKEIQRLEGVELAMRLQINTYQENLALLAQENERLTQMSKDSQVEKASADKLRVEKEQRERKMKDLQKEVESATAREKRYKEENEGLRERLRGTLVQERESEGWEFKNRQLRDEIDVLKSQVLNKDEELRSANQRLMKERNERFTLQRKNEQLSRMGSNRCGEYGAEAGKEQYESRLKQLSSELRQREEAMQSLEEEVEKKDEIHSLLSAEVERLNKALQNNVKEVMNSKKEVDFLQHKVRTCEESLRQRNTTQIASEKSIAEAESKSKIDICEGKIRNYEGELQLLRQRYDSLKKEFAAQEGRLTHALNEKSLLEQRASELEYQISEKSSNFRHVEDSFKLTILEIKKSNERLEQSLRQIENHYIGKLEAKERECEEVARQRKALENDYYELQRKHTSVEMLYGSQLKEKNTFISNLSTNHNQAKEEMAEIRRIKGEYEVKISLLSQEIERVSHLNEQHAAESERLREALRASESQLANSFKESTGSQQTLDLLSSEIERLNSVLVGNVDKIREHTKRTARLEMENAQLGRELEAVGEKNRGQERQLSEERESLADRIHRLEELNKELKYQLQEKTKDADRFLERVKLLERKEQGEANEYMRTVAEEMKLLREGNQKLEGRLGVITREYEQLVAQLEYYKRPKSSENDEKMRIIGNYEATIKHMKEENSALTIEKGRAQAELERLGRVAHEVQERGKIAEERARVLEEKSRRMEERCRVLEERVRSSEEASKGERQAVEQKLLAALEEVGRLQGLLKGREGGQEYYGETMRDRKGIFVIKEASECDERSRSASGNNVPPVRQPPLPAADLQHRYELLEAVHRKVSAECECLRKKGVEYEFKMGKLKEEFDLINRLIHEYREENEKLKENNRLLALPSPPSRNNSHLSPPREDALLARSKLTEEVDRLNRINNALQGEIHDLRLSAADAISLRRRHEEGLAVMVLLVAELEALRARVREGERGGSPRKG